MATGTGGAGGSDNVPGGSISRGGSLPNPRLSQSSQASQAASLLGLNKPPVAGANTLASLAGLLGQQTSDSLSPNLSQKGPSVSTSGTAMKMLNCSLEPFYELARVGRA